ncbi:glycoside hydrolase family 71/99-like protein [Sphingobacterium sp.]|jgi:hypothetical protein|uniref:glycoside hydrolase family 71/99-like protein n=1 Tax=Sphingobacterium sp. TaxID=341027 RepID=UPI002FDB6EA2
MSIKQQKKVCIIFLLIALMMSCSKSEKKIEESIPKEEAKKANGNNGLSATGDVVGQITVGYQGWFSCAGDNSPMGTHWWHWTEAWQQTPTQGNFHIPSWPDNSEYQKKYNTNLPALGNGSPASLFSSFDDQTVNVQFKWMKDYGIHTAALQRFNPTGIEGPIRNAITAKVKTAAEQHGVKFYIMYDVSAWVNMQTEIKNDWLNLMKQYTQSPAYAKQNGKPVIGIWGFGFNDNNHPWSAAVCLEVIQWFRDQGCYVMGGTPTHWRLAQTGGDSRQGYIDVYKSFDMLSPWMVGRIGTIADVDHYAQHIQNADLQFCNLNNIDYQPCVLPGSLQEGQRKHGDFMWRQFYNLTALGVKSMYVSMFDEYNESNQIAKTAATQQDVPVGLGIKSMDEDGTPCSSDYYLRITMDGGKMLKGQIVLSPNRPTSPQ